jgi:hypothetical protein
MNEPFDPDVFLCATPVIDFTKLRGQGVFIREVAPETSD